MNEYNEYGAILNLTRCLMNAIENEKEQYIKHLHNKRCREPEFTTIHYYLGRLIEREGLSPLTHEETEQLIRKFW